VFPVRCPSAQNLLSSRLLSENVKIQIRKSTCIILPVILYECETWYLTLWVSENSGARGTVGPGRDQEAGGRGEGSCIRAGAS
jgi:hypothetical protein